MAMQNGVFDANILTPIESEGDYLIVMPATEWIGYAQKQWGTLAVVHNIRQLAKEFKARTGKALVITECFRSIATQRHFRELYLAGRGNFAAVPGTSKHGWGLAFDLGSGIGYGGTPYAVMAEIGPKYGFTNTEGLSLNPQERWHWVGAGVAVGAGTGAKPIPEKEDEDMAHTIQAVYLDKDGSSGSPIYASTGVFTTYGGFEVTSVGRGDRGFLSSKLIGAALVGATRLPDLHVDAAGWEFVNSLKLSKS